jgi:Peptidase propeptide and YPEB domain
MNCIVIVLVSALLTTCSMAQDQRDRSRGLTETAKQARVALVDAVQKANAAVPGTVVGASLQPATKETKTAWRVVVLREGRLFTVSVDAVSGAVGKPMEQMDDDDDEQGEAKVEQRESAKLDFEDVAPGSLPAGWSPAETAGAGKLATWRVAEATGAPSGKHVLRLHETRNSGETFNMLMSATAFPADVDVGVKIRAESGEEDRGGGLVWRARDANNYYIARWNPLEDNLRAYKVQGGRRTMFKSVDLKADAAKWHALRIRAQGSKFQVLFDDKLLIEFEDDTFRQGGKVGVWTKADAASSFDDLEVAARR